MCNPVLPKLSFASTAAPFSSSSCAIVVWPTRCAIPSCQNSPSRPPRHPSQAAAAPSRCRPSATRCTMASSHLSLSRLAGGGGHLGYQRPHGAVPVAALCLPPQGSNNKTKRALGIWAKHMHARLTVCHLGNWTRRHYTSMTTADSDDNDDDN
eukprot:PhM_4_TR5300/c0_g2_i5/m.25059